MATVFVLSDTHGKLPPDHDAIVAEADVVLHAGDIGSDAILERLEAGPPLHIIGGNNDRDGRCGDLPTLMTFDLLGLRVLMVHEIADAPDDRSEFDLIVYGHSHRPALEQKKRQLTLNPGSYACPRFGVPASYAVLQVDGGRVTSVAIRYLS